MHEEKKKKIYIYIYIYNRNAPLQQTSCGWIAHYVVAC
jgi:hypothetical protein